MNFTIDNKELDSINEWRINHNCTITEEGAIGGKTTYQFTPTGLGTTVCAICACGKEIDVTDYNEW